MRKFTYLGVRYIACIDFSGSALGSARAITPLKRRSLVLFHFFFVQAETLKAVDDENQSSEVSFNYWMMALT